MEQVVVSRVDEQRRPIPDTEMVFDCDTLLLSVGLIPENELTRQAGIAIDPRTSGAVVYENMETSLPGVFACGNVAHVHDLVDFVTAESQRAGRAAARYVLEGPGPEEPALEVVNGEAVAYTVPQHIRPGRVEQGCELFFPGQQGMRAQPDRGHQRRPPAGFLPPGLPGPRRDGAHHPAPRPSGQGRWGHCHCH